MAPSAASHPSERIRPSATVIITRRAPHLEVYLVERARKTRFFPGYHAFPGGVLEKEDGDGLDGHRAAALRELEEETGLRLAGPEALVEAGRILTPAFGPVRYDTTFYMAELPEGQAPRVDGEELVSGKWWRPADALRAWNEGALPIPPPTLAYLRLLAKHEAIASAAAEARETDGKPHHERFRIEMHPGVYVLPLHTPTLPPATTQNCWLVDGDTLLVIDPGTPLQEEWDVLFYTLDHMLRERPGRDVTVVITHHHGDHVGAVAPLKERYGARVLASQATKDALPKGLVDAAIGEGHTFDVGEWHGRKWRLEVMETPGHTHGHLALRDLRWGAVFAGDLVSGVSTILVDPEEGDMAAYMASLERCAALDPPLVLPGHGPAIPTNVFKRTLDHRRMREQKALDALTDTPQTVEELVPVVYDDTPQAAWMLAARSLESILHLLEQTKRARLVDGERWTRA